MSIADMSVVSFRQHVIDTIEDIAADVCEFEDVPDFERDMTEIFAKYRERAVARKAGA